jgi:hypothetical protein
VRHVGAYIVQPAAQGGDEADLIPGGCLVPPVRQKLTEQVAELSLDAPHQPYAGPHSTRSPTVLPCLAAAASASTAAPVASVFVCQAQAGPSGHGSAGLHRRFFALAVAAAAALRPGYPLK